MNILKKYSNKINTKYLYVFVIIAFFGIGFLSLQAGYGASSVWDVDNEITGITINGQYYAYDNVPSSALKSYRQISWDPDGEPTAISNMNSAGLLPTYEISLGAIFFARADGTPVSDTKPIEITVDSEGLVHLTYYMGYSISILTRGSHTATVVYNFDYYGTTLNTLYQKPEFRYGSVAAEIGIRLIQNDATVPTVASVVGVDLTATRKVYTAARSLGMPESIDEFNTQFASWGNYYHKGNIGGGTSSDFTLTKLTVTTSNSYGAKANLVTSLDPGSSYGIITDIYGGWVSGWFNVYDVECVTTYLAKLDLSYNPAADVNDYLQNRLDFMINRESEHFDIWYYFMQFLAWIANALGLPDIFAAALVFILMVIAIIIFLIILKKKISGRTKTRLIYGF
jgi:hypothetical protein